MSLTDAQNEVFIAASPKWSVTSQVPLGLILRIVTLNSRSGSATQAAPEQPEAGPSTPTKRSTPTTYGKSKARTPMKMMVCIERPAARSKKDANGLWCTRAFDKGARGGRAWRIDLDAWIDAGKSGRGWTIVVPPPMPDEKLEMEEKVSKKGKRRVKVESSDDEGSNFEGRSDDGHHSEGVEGEHELEGAIRTPQKRKRATTTTPRQAKGAKTPTKTKGTPRKRRTTFLPVPSHALDPATLPVDPYERALRLLHVGATPESLPCREEEFVDVLSRVEEGVESGGGGCLCELLLWRC